MSVVTPSWHCGHDCNADINAAKNVLWRFVTGPYGAGYKPVNFVDLHKLQIFIDFKERLVIYLQLLVITNVLTSAVL